MDLGAPELLIILIIGLLIFGSNRLPKLARSLGQASKEFKSATAQGWVEEQMATPVPTAPSATTPPPATTTAPAAEPPAVPGTPPPTS